MIADPRPCPFDTIVEGPVHALVGPFRTRADAIEFWNKRLDSAAQDWYIKELSETEQILGKALGYINDARNRAEKRVRDLESKLEDVRAFMPERNYSFFGDEYLWAEVKGYISRLEVEVAALSILSKGKMLAASEPEQGDRAMDLKPKEE